MGEEISRRDLFTRLHRVIGRSVSEFGKSIQKELPRRRKAPSGPELELPEVGGLLEGIPYVHPWIGVARAVSERLGRRFPYVLLLGASGEAFRISYRRDDARAALRRSPVNTFLAALAVCGLTGQATHGGTFDAAIGGIDVAVGKGLAVVVGARGGPGVVLSVDRKAREVRWLQVEGKPRRTSFDAFEAEWQAAWWHDGSAPLLRITVEKDTTPRPLDQVARIGIQTMELLLGREAPGPAAEGLRAWEAWAADLREGRIPEGQLGLLHGELLRSVAVGRLGAGRFLASVARALPEELWEPLGAAADEYARIHLADPSGGIVGTGLLPEVTECLWTGGDADPGKAADPAIRARAADLLLEVRDREAAALERVRSLPPDWRTP